MGNVRQGSFGRKIVDETKPEAWKLITGHNRVYLKRFFANIEYLCKRDKISRVKLKASVYERFGYKIGKNAIRHYQDLELYDTASLSYLMVYAVFFNEPFDRLISVDYSLEASMSERG